MAKKMALSFDEMVAMGNEIVDEVAKEDSKFVVDEETGDLWDKLVLQIDKSSKDHGVTEGRPGLKNSGYQKSVKKGKVKKVRKKK